MLRNFEISLALRYLRSRAKEKFISVVAIFSLLGIALGVTTLIVVTSVMNGFHEELLSKLIGIRGQITIYKSAGKGIGIRSYSEIKEQILAIKSVKVSVPTINRQILIINNKGSSSGAIINAVEDIDQLPMIAKKIIIGSGKNFSNGVPNGVIIGSGLAKNLGLEIGDKIKAIDPSSQGISPRNMTPKVTQLEIIAIFSTGMLEYDNIYIYMPLKIAQNIFKAKDTVDYIEIFLDDPMKSKEIISNIALGLEGGNLCITDWQAQNQHYIQALNTERRVTFLVITLIIVVAAFNITSSLIMLVQEKKGNIAILRTMGASRGSIMKIFFICGAIIGALGTLIGASVGICIIINFENIKDFLYKFINNKVLKPIIIFIIELPADLKYQDMLFIVTIALGLSFLATIFPAYKAAKHNPADILRYNSL
ncbi:multidrug ABC transporter substrate-binding protein [Rickettsiales bacterium]|nr:multidrug ABC transporter substrate-binding protein [Rickettsiales bacterium]